MGAALEFVKTNKNGWLIKSDNEEAILKVMREAVSAPKSTLNNLSHGAIESVENHSLALGAARFKSYVREGIQDWTS